MLHAWYPFAAADPTAEQIAVIQIQNSIPNFVAEEESPGRWGNKAIRRYSLQPQIQFWDSGDTSQIESWVEAYSSWGSRRSNLVMRQHVDVTFTHFQICHEKSKLANRAPGWLRENLTSAGTAPKLGKLFQKEPNVRGT